MLNSAPEADLVLVGGGHAHVQVVRRWMMDPQPAVRLTWVLDRPDAVYSGMVPGFVAGAYSAHELEIDCVPLGRRAGARVILAAATGLDRAARRVSLADRPALPYDAISFDVGSTVRGLDLPGVQAHALSTRPIRSFIDRVDAFLAAGPISDLRTEGVGAPDQTLAVVGGGAAGVELALTLDARMNGAGSVVRVELLTADAELLPGSGSGLRRSVKRELARRRIPVITGVRVVGVDAGRVVLEDGGERAADRVVWATGAAPTSLLGELGLSLDATGFLRVRDTLQSIDDDAVFAVGDCAALDSAPWVPKAGVHAVRQGPVLSANLRAFLTNGTLRPHRPQRDFLSLLTVDRGRAIGGKWGLAASGRSVFAVKDAIDRRFMQRFQVLGLDGADAPGFPTPESMGMEVMPCGGCAAKVGAGGLQRALARLDAAPEDARVLLGLQSPDDAAAIRTASGDTVLATVDGFRAFTDDPWLVGRVAAENAASDVDATGGTARHALAWVTVPDGRGAEETLFQVMAGVRRVLDARGISLIGGHSTTGPELVVGLAVLGDLPDGATILSKSGLRPGDALVLTKPLGSGVLLAADMQGRATGAQVLDVHDHLLHGNASASAVARRQGARSLTDVSGFGLAVHLGEMLDASQVGAVIDPATLPAMPGARQALRRGLRSTFHPQNAAAAAGVWAPGTDPETPDHALCLDPQTSGGLLIGIAPEQVAALLKELTEAGHPEAAVIGHAKAPTIGAPRLVLDE